MSLTMKHFYRFEDFTVDTDQRILLCQGKPLPLTPKVFATLLILVENSGRIVEKEALMNRLWPDTFVEEANLGFNIQQLRKALGDDARHPRFIETVARRGYRFIAPVEGPLDSSVATNQIAPTRVQAADSPFIVGGEEFKSDLGLLKSLEIESPGADRSDYVLKVMTGRNMSRTSRRKTLLAATAVAMILGAVGSLLLLRHRSSATAQPENGRLMLAVLPFQNLTGDASQDYFSDGLTEEMITQLGNLDPDHLGVIARTSVMQYKNSREPMDQIGRELQIQYVLEGSVRRESDRVRITAQLIQTKDQSHLWAREYDREVVHLLSLQGEIAKEVTDEIHRTLGGHSSSGQASQTSSGPTSYEAYDLYLKGQYFFNQRNVAGFKQAIDYFQQATTKDPSYARAYAGLADCYALLGGYSELSQPDFMPKARAAARRAVELDGNLPEAHTALALIVQNYDWDWQTAENEFRRAIELNPNYATAHHWYAEHLTWLGRFDEALSESERARQLDPLSLIIAADNGATLYYSRQYDQAIAKFRVVREMDPNFPRTGVIRFAYEQKGLFTDVLEEIEKWRHVYGDQPWTWSELAYVYGRSGHQAQAERALQKLLQWDQRKPVDPAAIVWAYLGVGNKDQALAYLEKAYLQHSATLATLRVEPGFDPLRSDPRYQDLLRRVGLAQ
ncbi:MAG TPA: winged helix-turn-helix domain-containing protein [Pyrinomonadaceae bacterium]|nr:winged helix-turn-helix domain-containing protein [Pyrinomonadaceae bacterium]